MITNWCVRYNYSIQTSSMKLISKRNIDEKSNNYVTTYGCRNPQTRLCWSRGRGIYWGYQDLSVRTISTIGIIETMQERQDSPQVEPKSRQERRGDDEIPSVSCFMEPAISRRCADAIGCHRSTRQARPAWATPPRAACPSYSINSARSSKITLL